MKFRIWTILWVFALIASALATFEAPTAIGSTAVITFTWDLILVGENRGISLAELLMALVLWTMLWALATPAITRSYETERVADCQQQLARVAKAAIDYRKQHGTLPLNGFKTPNANVPQSWRTLILPQMGQRDLYKQYDTSKPWGDPVNVKVGNKRSLGYCCRNDSCMTKQGLRGTSYFAATGPGTAWATMKSNNGQIKDDPSKTILLIEQLGTGIAWCEPSDIAFEDAIKILTADPCLLTRRDNFHAACTNGFFEKRPPAHTATTWGFHVAFADGSVRFVAPPLSTELATALLTANGGEHIPDAKFAQLWKAGIDYKRICAFGLFILIALLPCLKRLKGD